jgi:hypothetical protein
MHRAMGHSEADNVEVKKVRCRSWIGSLKLTMFRPRPMWRRTGMWRSVNDRSGRGRSPRCSEKRGVERGMDMIRFAVFYQSEQHSVTTLIGCHQIDIHRLFVSSQVIVIVSIRLA